MGLGGWWCVLALTLLCFCSCPCDGQQSAVEEADNGTLVVNGKKCVARIDANFICATLDWYPPQNCNFGRCSWGHSSVLHLDLNNPVLMTAVKAFSPMKLRLGGSLQDRLLYQSDLRECCIDFVMNKTALFYYNQGCLSLDRWDELNSFFAKAGALVIFGLNELLGKEISPDHMAIGPWNSTNAASLIQYTVEKRYNIYGWELGNELSERGAVVGIDVDPYAEDTFTLRDLIRDTYKGSNLTIPHVIGPGGFYNHDWFGKYLTKTRGALDVVTHHVYNIGIGNQTNSIEKILDPAILDSGSDLFKQVYNVVKESKSQAVPWVGEAGGISQSGRDGVTNAFVFSFWYLDQLGQASIYNTKTYCRQSLIGGYYGFLDSYTFTPNPDFYSALLWHRLMGRNVLSAIFTGTKTIRAYAHCAKQSQGVTLLMMNIGNTRAVLVDVQFNKTLPGFRCGIREEYLLTPKDGNIQSRTILLNGEALNLGMSGRLPALLPRTVNSSEPIIVGPMSILYVHLPCVAVPACILG